MIRFLGKGLLRDAGRSRMPVMVVAIGVALSVFMHAYVHGLMQDSIEMNARMRYGHVKVCTRSFADNAAQMPADLSLLDVRALKQQLTAHHPNLQWSDRIQFAGLMDVPGMMGETRAQGPVIGMAVDFFSTHSVEGERLNVQAALTEGRLPQQAGEMLLSADFAEKLGVQIGDTLMFMGSTQFGGLAYANFVLIGCVDFGVEVLDRGMMLADLSDVRIAMDMEDAATEIVGFFEGGQYNDAAARRMQESFAADFEVVAGDPYAPVLLRLKDQDDMGQLIDISGAMGLLITFIFLLAMSLVLWNAGLLGGIRRYGEFGLRLAMGETKGHVYRSLQVESLLIGLLGSLIGTVLGLLFAWWMQEKGLNLGDSMQNASMMLPTVIRARITPVDFYIGFIPGVFATLIGSLLSGLGIFKRNTAQLFKELET